MDPSAMRSYGAAATAITVIVAFFFSMVYAYFFQNDGTIINMVIGAVLAKFADVVSYFTGSSASSREKDAKIEAAQARPIASTSEGGVGAVAAAAMTIAASDGGSHSGGSDGGSAH